MGGKGIWTRGEGDGADRLAARKPRQQARLLRVVTVKLDRLGSAEARRQERRAAERSPRLMRDQAEFDEAEIKPAIGLGKRKRGPALLLRRRPEAFMIFAAGLEQQQIVLADPCLERAPRLGDRKSTRLNSSH